MAIRALLILAFLIPLPILGAEVAGVKLEDKTDELVLNGAGLRTKVIFNVYVIGLYLPGKKSDAAAVLPLAGTKPVPLHIRRHVSAAPFSEALDEAIPDNHSQAPPRVL